MQLYTQVIDFLTECNGYESGMRAIQDIHHGNHRRISAGIKVAIMLWNLAAGLTCCKLEMWQASVSGDGAMVRTMPTAQKEDV